MIKIRKTRITRRRKKKEEKEEEVQDCSGNRWTSAPAGKIDAQGSWQSKRLEQKSRHKWPDEGQRGK